jgi:hypothetical protein
VTKWARKFDIRYFEMRVSVVKFLPLLCFLTMLSSSTVGKNEQPSQTPSVESIVAKLVAANQRRSRDLRGYHGRRYYHLDYHGFLGSHSADMQVDAVYTAPDKKEFKVISQSGSKVLINRVLLKLLDSEKEASQQQTRRQIELSPENYNFSFVGTERSPAGTDSYILSVQPREKNKYLYSGKIWVDAKDFAVSRMEGEPAKNLSLWISRTTIEYIWTRIGEFWLPSSTKSVTQVRLGGAATLTIQYTDYQVTGLSRTDIPRGSDKSVLPDPSSVTPDER